MALCSTTAINHPTLFSLKRETAKSAHWRCVKGELPPSISFSANYIFLNGIILQKMLRGVWLDQYRSNSQTSLGTVGIKYMKAKLLLVPLLSAELLFWKADAIACSSTLPCSFPIYVAVTLHRSCSPRKSTFWGSKVISKSDSKHLTTSLNPTLDLQSTKL